MANQIRANIGAENHVKHARRQARCRDRTHNRLGSQFRRRHMSGMGFHHHRTTRRQRGMRYRLLP